MADNNEIFELMTKVYSEMQSGFSNINKRLDSLENRMKNVESQVIKNSVLLEKVDSNVKLLAEGQEAFREQIGRSNDKDNRTINDKLEVVEIAVSHVSKDVNNMVETVEVIKDATASNEMDLRIIKRLQSKNL